MNGLQPDVEVDFTGLSMEMQIVVQRLQLLGFNAVRLPMTFGELLNPVMRNYTLPCERPDLLNVCPHVGSLLSILSLWGQLYCSL